MSAKLDALILVRDAVHTSALVPESLIVTPEISRAVDLIVGPPTAERGEAWADVFSAYEGSLDAAKSLHIALLGDGYISWGWKWLIRGHGQALVWDVITGLEAMGQIFMPPLHPVCHGRAWLLAIINALILIEDQKQ